MQFPQFRPEGKENIPVKIRIPVLVENSINTVTFVSRKLTFLSKFLLYYVHLLQLISSKINDHV